MKNCFKLESSCIPFLKSWIFQINQLSNLSDQLSNVSLPVFLTCLRPITRVSFHKIWNFGISSITKNFSSKSNSALSYRIIIALNDKFLRFLRLFLFSIFVMLVYYFNACLHVRHSVYLFINLFFILLKFLVSFLNILVLPICPFS